MEIGSGKKEKMLHLYHVPTFRSTRVAWLYLELRKIYHMRIPKLVVNEFKDVETFRNQKEEWYLKMNPNGKVPFLVDLGTNVAMFESGAICTYLLETYDLDGVLLDKLDPIQRSLFFQLAFYSTGTLDNLTATSSPVQRAVLASQSGQANMKVTVNPVNQLAWNTICGPYFEAMLQGKTYLNGDTFGAVDIMIGHSLFGLDEKMKSRGDGTSWLDAFPNVKEYNDRLKRRDIRALVYQPTDTWPKMDGVEIRAAEKVFS